MPETVEETLRNVLRTMAQAGFKIDQEVQVVVDEKLPFMGYTSLQWRSHVIVVSGFAVKSSMLEGLLVHELSHIYRNITNHPSHNEKLIASLTRLIMESHRLGRDYEQETLHQAINHIQDLYADDISVKVLAAYQGTLSTMKQLSEFFLGWIKQEPAKTGERRRDRWINASTLLNNCFAVSNMQRHKMVEEQLQRAKFMNERFLNRIKPAAAERFHYFNRFMISLKETVSEAEFHEQMTEYLQNLLQIVDNI